MYISFNTLINNIDMTNQNIPLRTKNKYITRLSIQVFLNYNYHLKILSTLK